MKRFTRLGLHAGAKSIGRITDGLQADRRCGKICRRVASGINGAAVEGAQVAELAVHWDGQRVGRIVESSRDDFCIFGRFVPEAGFELCREAFEAAYRGDQEYAHAAQLSGDPVGAERGAWHAAIDAITPHVSLPDVGEPIEEFGVFADNAVEVYLPESWAAPEASARGSDELR
jgi:hypothetical protein